MLKAVTEAVVHFDSGRTARAAVRAVFGGAEVRGALQIDVYRLLLLYKDGNHEAMGRVLFGGQSARQAHIVHLQSLGKAQRPAPARERLGDLEDGEA